MLLLNITAKIFLIVLFGYFLKKFGIITAELQKGLNNLLLTAILPVNILSSAGHEFSSKLAKNLLITAIICTAYYISALIFSTLLSKRLKTDINTKKIFITMSVFANVGFLGFPLIEVFIGADGMLYAVIYNMAYQMIFFTYGINMICSGGKFQLSSLYKSPVTMSSAAALLIYLSPFRFPDFIQQTFSSIGAMMTPLSMILIGCSMTGIRPRELLADKYSYVVSFLRLLFFPAVMLSIFVCLGLQGEVFITAVILTALPSGSLNAILAQQYNCNPEYASRTIIQSMILMLISLPLILTVSTILIGR